MTKKPRAAAAAAAAKTPKKSKQVESRWALVLRQMGVTALGTVLSTLVQWTLKKLDSPPIPEPIPTPPQKVPKTPHPEIATPPEKTP